MHYAHNHRRNFIPDIFVLMPNELERTFVRAFEVVKPLMGSYNETCTAHVDCQLAAVNAIRVVFGCSIRICLFHLNQAVWRSVSRFGLAGYYNNTRFPKLHVWIRRLFALPFLPEDAINSNFDVLFERDAIHGPIHVEDECLDAFQKLVRYYKTFWLTRVPMKMWCNNTTRERTNNRCEGFHNGLRNSIPLARPNPFILIELLRKNRKVIYNAIQTIPQRR